MRNTTKLQTLEDLLGLIAVELPIEILEKLTPQQQEEAANWAADCHLEASDNDVTASACPEALRNLLPDNHFYKKWRVSF